METYHNHARWGQMQPDIYGKNFQVKHSSEKTIWRKYMNE